MRLSKALIYAAAALIVAAAALILFAPIATSTVLRVWLAWSARRCDCEIHVGKIEAPFLHAVVLRDVRLSTASGASAQIANLRADINFARLVPGSRGRALRHLQADGVRVVATDSSLSTALPHRLNWSQLSGFLADNFEISGSEITFDQAPIRVTMKEFSITGSELEAGVFIAREVSLRTPTFEKSFRNLRGATSWQESRLAFGAVSLLRGLDVDSLTLDFSQIAQEKIGIQANVDAFGGKVRVTLSNLEHDSHRAWNVAATVSELSIAQLSDSLNLTDRASGILRTCKITFRGDSNEPADASAAIWAEIEGMTWRDRTADAIMIGASLYNREVQVQQIYVKQRQNQLTLSGESALPLQSQDWLNPDFRGDISASIGNLGEFARLFGASASSFAGEMSIDGNVTARDRILDGRLLIFGTGLRLFGVSPASLQAKLNLQDSRLELEQFEINRSADFVRAHGEVEMRGQHAYSASLAASVSRLADYPDWLDSALEVHDADGGLNFSGTTSGTAHALRGAFEVQASNLRFKSANSRARVSAAGISAALRGEADLGDNNEETIRLFPIQPLAVGEIGPGECVSSVELSGALPRASTAVTEIDLRRGFGNSLWSISMSAPERWMNFCAEGTALTFGADPTTR